MVKKMVSTLLLMVFLACWRGEHAVFAQNTLTDAAKQRLKERDRCRKEALTLQAQGKVAEAIAAAEKGLAIDREVFGNRHQEVANALADLAPLYLEQEDFVRAREAFGKALAIGMKLHSDNHWFVVNVRLALAHLDFVAKLSPEQRQRLTRASQLLGKVDQLNGQQKYVEAIGLAREAADIYERILGERSLHFGYGLYALANLWSKMARYQEAEPLYQRGLAILEAELGKDHPKVALILNNLAILYAEIGQHAKAEGLFRRCLQIREANLDKDHPYVAESLENLANLYTAMARYGEAQPLYQRSLAIAEAKLGKDHLNVAGTLNNLAGLYMKTGQYAKAEPLCQRSLEIKQARLGKDHSEVADGLNNLGILYECTADYAKAEPLYQRSLAIREAKLGKDHPAVATSLENLANLCMEMSQYAKAEPLYQHSLEIRKARLGKSHPDVAQSLNNLGIFYRHMSQYAKAEPLLLQSLKIREAKLGKDHPDVAASLDNLANLYLEMSQFAKAEPLYQRSLAIKEARLGTDHPDVAATLNNLGILYGRTADYAKAEPLYQRSLAIREAKLGKDHPEVSATLYNLAVLYLGANRPDKALALQEKCMEVDQANLRAVFGFSAEPAMHAYLAEVSRHLDVLLDITTASQDVSKTALTWTLRRKGIILNTLCRFREAQRLLPEDKSVAGRVAELRGLRQRLANMALMPPQGVDSAKFQLELAVMREEADRLEGQLNRALTKRHAPELGDSEEVDTDRIRTRLSPEAALIELVRARLLDRKAMRWQPPHYFAFVLTAGSDPPRMFDLGAAEAIDQAVKKVREQVERAPRDLRLTDEKTLESDFRAVAADAYRLVFAPLRPALGQAKFIYLAADGELNRVPFEALPDADGKYLVESMRFAYLSSGRDLLRQPAKAAAGTVVFAGPSFDLKAEDRQAKAKQLVAAATKTVPREVESGLGLRSSKPEVRGQNWKALPGAAAEAEDVRRALQDSTFSPVQTYVGAEALEEVFKAMRPPRVLHIATHGFFLPDPKEDLKDREQPVLLGTDAGGLGRLRKIDNPLLRSGIVLAGANALLDETPPAGVDDGWVTAEEIALMNLRGTDLVVLSACETGLGDIKTGEGVYGLRRAFIYAGARTLVTSLFKVPDEQTRQIMRSFYGGLKAGKGKLASLHDAQLEVIRQRRREHAAAHPFFWASFVLVGDPD